MKKILSLLALVLMSCMGAWAQTVIARMGDFVNNGTNNGVTEAVSWQASEDKVYSFNGSSSYFGGITNDVVVSALEGDKYVTVACYVYGNSLNGSPFGYGDAQDGLKFTFFGGTSAQVTTKSVDDFTQTSLESMNANAWNLVAFTVPGKTCTGTDSRYLSPAGHYTKTGKNLSNMKAPSNKKFAIGSGDQGTTREVFNSMLANVTVMTSDALLDFNAVKAQMAAAPTLTPEGAKQLQAHYEEVSAGMYGNIVKRSVDPATTIEEGWYVLNNVGRGNCVLDNGSAFKMAALISGYTGVTENTLGYLFHITPSETEGKWNIRSGLGHYVSLSYNGSSFASGANDFTIEKNGSTAGVWSIKDENSGRYADGQATGNYFVGWTDTKPTNGTGNDAYRLYKIEEGVVCATDLGHMKDAKWYQLNVRNKYVQYNASTNKFADELTSANAEDNTRWFAFVGNNNDGYKIVNYVAGADKAMGAANTTTDTRIEAVPFDDAHSYIFKNVTYNNAPAIQLQEKDGSNHAFLNQQGTNLGYWDGGASGDIGNVFVFTEVEDAIYNCVAFNCTATNNGENTITWNTTPVFTAENTAATSMVYGGEFVTDVTITEDDKTLGEGNYQFTVRASHSLPFEEGKFYLLKNRYENNHVAVDGNEKTYARSTRNMHKANYLWSFERVDNTPDQFYVKNLSLDKYIGGATGQVVSYSANPTAYTILKQNTGFCLSLPNTAACVGSHTAGSGLDANFPNSVHSDGNPSLSTWLRTANNASPYARNDNGSVFWVEEFDEAVFDGDPLIVGSFASNNSTAVDTYKTEKNAANLKTALATLEEVLIAPDKYYTIRENVRANNQHYMGAAPNADANGDFSANCEISCLASDQAGYTLLNSLFQFVPSNTKYNLKHVNSGLNVYAATHNSRGNLTTGTAGAYSVVHYSADNTKIGFVNADGVYLNTNSVLTRVDGWKDTSTVENSDGDRWTVKEVTEIPVTVGSVGYTTVCFPMAVTIPDGVTAYKVTAENENSMTLAEVEGSVPAGTALIIEASANTYNFTIATSDTDAAGNLLLGTTARRTGFDENSFYALAADANAKNGVSFKINGSVNAVPANKAYLPVSAGSSNKALYFDFGGETLTGIDAVEALPATNALYNINGQRVVAPTRGIYVKANGQKVFIK